MSKTKIFISWSGERSKALANTFRYWLPKALQSVDPFCSDKDIKAGDVWDPVLSNELEESKFGIVCLTEENLKEPWINYEAGALYRQMRDRSFVCPVLLNISPGSLEGPLSRFQAVATNYEGIFKLMEGINSVLNEPLEPTMLKETFDKWWPDLEKSIQMIPPTVAPQPQRSTSEMVEETLDLVRGISNFLEQEKEDQSLVAWAAKLRTQASTEALELLAGIRPTRGTVARSIWNAIMGTSNEKLENISKVVIHPVKSAPVKDLIEFTNQFESALTQYDKLWNDYAKEKGYSEHPNKIEVELSNFPLLAHSCQSIAFFGGPKLKNWIEIIGLSRQV